MTKMTTSGVDFMGITLAQWLPEYETGDHLVDEQHQSLFSIINSLNNAMLEGQGEALLQKTLESLKDYTTVHFDTEEEFMLRHNYPGYQQHQIKHEALKTQVLEFEHKNYNNLSQLTIEVSHFLTDWLIHHIKDEDRKMIRFCCHGYWFKPHSDSTQSSVTLSSQFEIARWHSKYETGYTLIDDQHKSLFHAINALNTAMLTGRAEELIQRTLKSLRNYTTIHFETEEQFMLHYGYPGYSEHKAKHQRLREQVEQFNQQEKTESSSELSINVSHFLTHWLIDHIKDEDQKMIIFLRQKRQKELIV
ncbi:bacteriohemerythrin [Planktothrix sp. FACHB-1365]|nr:bacteriohemerythrin [Planktothrix sp. FACHB-1365]